MNSKITTHRNATVAGVSVPLGPTESFMGGRQAGGRRHCTDSGRSGGRQPVSGCCVLREPAAEVLHRLAEALVQTHPRLPAEHAFRLPHVEVDPVDLARLWIDVDR